MNNININKENGIKIIRKLYSAVNDLLDILGRDINEEGYDKEKLGRKVQAYVKYLGDTKEWEEFTNRKDSNVDKDSLLDKVQDDVLDIMSLSTSREDADKARKALRQLSAVTSADVIDVLNSCIDDGGKVGKSTRYAKKKLIMNNVTSIYEKEETNNGAELYYNLVHGKYQILNGDKIYTTKRGNTEKIQDLHPQRNGEKEKVGDFVVKQMDENVGESPVILDNVGRKVDQAEVVEKGVEQPKEITEQLRKVDIIDKHPKEKNKESEEEVEWSEKKVIEELEKIQNIKGFENLQRCNDVEISFLARQLLKSSKAIDLLKKISALEGNEGNDEELNSEFKSMLDELFAKFMVGTKYFNEGPKELGIKSNGKLKTFRRIRSDFMGELGLNGADILGLKTISEYMAFISCMNNIKNSIIETRHKILGEGKGSLRYLLKGTDDREIKSKVRGYLVNLLRGKIKVFEDLKEKSSKNEFSKKMKMFEMQIELDFDSLIEKGVDGYSLSKSVEDELNKLVNERNQGNINIDGLMDLFMPVFIKMGILDKAYDNYPYHWFQYVDTTRNSPIIKYEINGKTIGLSISKLKDIEYKDSRLSHYYFDFKNVVLYAMYKAIKENDGCPYEFQIRNCKDISSFRVRDVYSAGDQFVENSHFGDCLKKVFDEENRVINGDMQSEPGDTGESTIIQEEGGEGSNEVIEVQINGGETMEITDASPVSGTETTEERIVENEGEKGMVEVIGQKEENPKNKNNKRQNNVSEGNDNVKNVTIEDIISFYANNDERVKLKSLKKAGGSDQRDCTKLRENYKIRIIKPGFKKGILVGLKTIADNIGEKTGNKINKPYTHKGFDAIVGELERLRGNT